MNSVTGRKQTSQSSNNCPSKLEISESIYVTDAKDILDNLNTFYTTIGLKLAGKLQTTKPSRPVRVQSGLIAEIQDLSSWRLTRFKLQATAVN